MILEEYRDRLADKQLASSCTSEMHFFQCGCNDIGDGFIRGFDAAMDLDLPVKFTEWKEGYDRQPHLNRIEEISDLYKYWIENIYKLR